MFLIVPRGILIMVVGSEPRAILILEEDREVRAVDGTIRWESRQAVEEVASGVRPCPPCSGEKCEINFPFRTCLALRNAMIRDTQELTHVALP